MAQTRTAFIAIVGSPNVGKSSILNRLLGQKVAIVSSKPQTTRTRIMGVLTKEETQLVFTDTPGFHRPGNKLGEKMVQAVGDSIADVDTCLLVVEPGRGVRENERKLLEKFRATHAKAVLAINKIDTLKSKEALAARIAEFSNHYAFEAIVPVSAQTGEGMDALEQELCGLAEESVHFFPDDTLTDQPERVLAAEMIREKMLRLLEQEIPHGVAVQVERMCERPNGGLMDVEATVYCEKETHKGIIIGKGGAMLKKISTYAREDMERFFGCHVNLRCWVKVKPDWRNRAGLIHSFGLD